MKHCFAPVSRHRYIKYIRAGARWRIYRKPAVLLHHAAHKPVKLFYLLKAAFCIGGCRYRCRKPGRCRDVFGSRTHALLLLAAGCAREQPAQSDGTLRLVSTAPNLTECVFAIGAGDLIVGRTEVCDYPPEAVKGVPITGSFGIPWLEPLIAVRPTHVLETVLSDPAIRDRLTELGLPVVHVQCFRLADIPDAIRQLGTLTGRETRANALADDITRGLAEAAAAPPAANRPRVLMLFAPDTPITAGRNAFVSELLETAGAINLGRDSTTDYYHISLEWIIGQDPDILLCLFNTTGRPPVSFFAGQTGWKALRAVRENRVYTLANLDSACRPGPRVLDGLAQFQSILTLDANR